MAGRTRGARSSSWPSHDECRLRESHCYLMPTPNGRRRDCKTRVDLLFRVILRTHGPLGKRGETNAAPSARRLASLRHRPPPPPPRLASRSLPPHLLKRLSFRPGMSYFMTHLPSAWCVPARNRCLLLVLARLELTRWLAPACHPTQARRPYAVSPEDRLSSGVARLASQLTRTFRFPSEAILSEEDRVVILRFGALALIQAAELA